MKALILLPAAPLLLAACSARASPVAPPDTPSPRIPAPTPTHAPSRIPLTLTTNPDGTPHLTASLPSTEKPDCSRVESLPADGTEGQLIAGALKDYFQGMEEELVDIHSIQRQGDYYAVLSGYQVNRQPGPPGFFVLKRTGEAMEPIFAIFGGGVYTREMFIRNLNAEVPGLPPELLNCLDVSELFIRLTPAPTYSP